MIKLTATTRKGETVTQGDKVYFIDSDGIKRVATVCY